MAISQIAAQSPGHLWDYRRATAARLLRDCGPPDFVKPVARDSMRTTGVQIKFATARRGRQYPHHTCRKTNSGPFKIPKRPRGGLLRHSEFGLKKFELCSRAKEYQKSD